MVNLKHWSFYATIFSILAAVCFTGVNLYLLVTPKGTKWLYYLYGFPASVLILVMELPSMFSCIACCKSFAGYLSCCSGSLVGKGIVHILIGACGVAMYGKYHGTQGDGANLGMALLCLLTAVLYIMGSCNSEPAPGAEAKKEDPNLLEGANQFTVEDGNDASGPGQTRYEPFGDPDPESGKSEHSAGFGGDDYDDGIGANPFAS